MQLNYADGSNAPFSRNIDDWFDDERRQIDVRLLVASRGLDRVDSSGQDFNNADPAIFFVRIPVDVTKTLASIDFARGTVSRLQTTTW
ncbi:MAG: hypothetical protein R3C05_00680 [Pirellulaceae bacterium]